MNTAVERGEEVQEERRQRRKEEKRRKNMNKEAAAHERGRDDNMTCDEASDQVTHRAQGTASLDAASHDVWMAREGRQGWTKPRLSRSHPSEYRGRSRSTAPSRAEGSAGGIAGGEIALGAGPALRSQEC